jgi:glycosyltransferase involved in cell wall biosynthesis
VRTVAFLSPAVHLGGAERSLLELVIALQARPDLGYSPWVVLPRAEGVLLDELKKSGIRHTVLEVPERVFKLSRSRPLEFLSAEGGKSAVTYLGKLSALLKAEAPSIIHSNGIKFHYLSGICGPTLGIPVVWHVRDIFARGPVIWSLRLLKKSANVFVIANSAATASAFMPRDTTISVIHNGLDPQRYTARRNKDFHELLGVSPDAPMVGIIGVLARWKGQREFLEMARLLIDRGSNARFVVIGGEIYDTGRDAGYGEFLKSEALRLGIADRVLFTGFAKDPVRAIGGLDVLVHASIKPEPFGRVILEAMACEVPVVASSEGGVLELIEEGSSGLLYPPGNVTAMTEAVQRVLTDAALRERLKERALFRYQQNFTSVRHVEAVARLYDSIISP